MPRRPCQVIYMKFNLIYSTKQKQFFDVDLFFCRVIDLLRELWDCELKSFETVGKLTEIFVLRAETLTELGKLAEQVRTNSVNYSFIC